MANPGRRLEIVDAALACLGEDGSRAVSFRSVDSRAGLPKGTTSNYFATRADLFIVVAHRAFELLTPDPARIDAISRADDARAAFQGYVSYVVERLLGRPDLALALVELRLAARRDVALAGTLQPFLQQGLRADTAFHQQAGLPGDAETVELLHHAINGLVLDQLTVPLNPVRDAQHTAATIAACLVLGDV